MRKGEDKFYKSTKEALQKNPQRYWQIGDFLRVDKLTGKDYVDEQYVKLYGNPYNEYDKTSKWITIDLNEKEDQDRALRSYYRREAEETKDLTFEIMHQHQYSKEQDAIKCITCTALNHPRCYHCWYCGGHIGLSKFYLERRL